MGSFGRIKTGFKTGWGFARSHNEILQDLLYNVCNVKPAAFALHLHLLFVEPIGLHFQAAYGGKSENKLSCIVYFLVDLPSQLTY